MQTIAKEDLFFRNRLAADAIVNEDLVAIADIPDRAEFGPDAQPFGGDVR